MTTRREQIVQTARDLFLQAGLEGVSMRRVADEVGISATAIYRHFDNKDALITAVVDEGRHLFAKYLFEALEAPGPGERLQRAGERYLDFAFDHPGYFRVFFLSLKDLDAKPHAPGDPAKQPMPPTLQFLFDRIGDCTSAGLLPADANRMDLTLLFWAQAHGLACMWVAGGVSRLQDLASFRTQCHRVLAHLLDAMLLSPSAP